MHEKEIEMKDKNTKDILGKLNFRCQLIIEIKEVLQQLKQEVDIRVEILYYLLIELKDQDPFLLQKLTKSKKTRLNQLIEQIKDQIEISSNNQIYPDL